MTKARSRWLSLLAVVVVAGAAVLLRNAIEWVDIDVVTEPKNEAARDRFYASKALVRALGGRVVAPHSLEKLPPAGALLFLSSSHWNMFPGRDDALRRWVEGGGRLVLADMAVIDEVFVPRWAPLRSVDASEKSASAGAAKRRAAEPCRALSEPDAVPPAFGQPRSFRVCGYGSSRLKSQVLPQWSIGDLEGTRMARVAVGLGSVTASTMQGAFTNRRIVDGDGALAFVAALDLRSGDEVWFVDEEARTPLLRALWSSAPAALLLAAAALALALWRHGPRFGPLAIAPEPARRSIGEQIRRTAAFIAAGPGEALHRASLRALEATASRTIADFESLLTVADRARGIASRIGVDPAVLAAAMQTPKRRRALAPAIAELEHARRALLPAARIAPSTSTLHTPTP